MNIEINGVVYTVPEAYVNKLASDLFAIAEQGYQEKVDDTMKVGMMVVTRTMLAKEEMTVRMKLGKEAAKAMRPPPKADPNIWLARQCLPTIQGMLHNATLTCQTESNTVTNLGFAIPRDGESGGQVDIAGDERMREDDSIKIS